MALSRVSIITASSIVDYNEQQLQLITTTHQKAETGRTGIIQVALDRLSWIWLSWIWIGYSGFKQALQEINGVGLSAAEMLSELSR